MGGLDRGRRSPAQPRAMAGSRYRPFPERRLRIQPECGHPRENRGGVVKGVTEKKPVLLSPSKSAKW